VLEIVRRGSADPQFLIHSENIPSSLRCCCCAVVNWW